MDVDRCWLGFGVGRFWPRLDVDRWWLRCIVGRCWFMFKNIRWYKNIIGFRSRYIRWFRDKCTIWPLK